MSTIIKEEIIDEIKSRSNIVDIVGKYVTIKKTGANYKGLCPFHSEDTPSFIVSEDKQIFTCFGCGATGDVIEFIKRIESIEFVDAVEKLAEESGVELKSTKEKSNNKKKDFLFQLNRDAALFFYHNLQNGNNAGYAYMKSRGISNPTLKKFGIGYAIDSWDSLYKYFKGRNIEDRFLFDLGLLSYSKGKYFDKFRNRVIFPIINTRGRIIGFGGRTIEKNALPKYLNSPESIIFQKKNNLYGLNLSRQEIQKMNSVILVEGYMDVISLYQRGIKNTAASLGTALTVQQAQMLKRYSNNIILAYDADEAGKIAALRGMDILYEAGCSVKVLRLKGYKDPDEYVKTYGKEAFMKLVSEAVPFIEYKLEEAKKIHDLNTTEGKVAYLKDAAIILRKIESQVEVEAYIKKIAYETKISENAFKLEIHGNNREVTKLKHHDKEKKPDNLSLLDKNNDLLERNLIKLMIIRSEFIPKIRKYSEVFTNSSHQRIYELINVLYTEDEEIDVMKLKDNLMDEDIAALNKILENIQFSGKEVQIFHDCINRIKNDRIKKRQNEIIEILQVLDEEEDASYIQQLTNELLDIQKNLNMDNFTERGDYG